MAKRQHKGDAIMETTIGDDAKPAREIGNERDEPDYVSSWIRRLAAAMMALGVLIIALDRYHVFPMVPLAQKSQETPGNG
jgi:hypothetical protein